MHKKISPVEATWLDHLANVKNNLKSADLRTRKQSLFPLIQIDKNNSRISYRFDLFRLNFSGVNCFGSHFWFLAIFGNFRKVWKQTTFSSCVISLAATWRRKQERNGDFSVYISFEQSTHSTVAKAAWLWKTLIKPCRQFDSLCFVSVFRGWIQDLIVACEWIRGAGRVR